MGALSGGERNRVLLAKVFTKPSNLLILDEPTNDLDIETLELLEQLLANYQGTIILVSHDRYFMNNIVTSTIVFENNTVQEYVGGYDDYLMQRPTFSAGGKSEPGRMNNSQKKVQKKSAAKLNYKEQRELAALPQLIESLESKHSGLIGHMSEADFYKQDGAQIANAKKQLEEIELDLKNAYAKWEQLEALHGKYLASKSN